MRNMINFLLPPEVVFLNPWRDPGFKLLLEPEFVWRPIEGARISGFATSAHPQINQKIKNVLKNSKQSQTFKQPIEYNSVPAMLDKASFRKSYLMARDRLLLTGAAGIRVVNKYGWENTKAGQDTSERLDAYFANCRIGNEGKEIPLYSGLLDTDTAFAVECRNTFNYYHFITESLAQLTVLDGLDFPGDIYFHFPNAVEKQQPFAQAFVAALFPEFEGRVHFERVPKDYAKVLTAYDLIGGHLQAPKEVSGDIEDLMPSIELKTDGTAPAAKQRLLAINSVNTSLLSLRERALRAIDGQNFDHLPTRFFVGRDTRQSRSRHMEGEERLFEHLELFGFEYVVFESLSPLEQIALMSRAEMMVSYHGAGFTNMLFASPDTYVIEIGTLQTAQIRWGDFWSVAHASKCKYVSFFADFRQDDPLSEPNFAKDGLVPAALSEEAIGRIMAFIVVLFGQYPQLKTPRLVAELAREVLEVGGAEHAIGLLEKHHNLLIQSSRLCLLKADCHKDLDEPKSELVALDLAHKADPTRWQTLIRMIWCAKRCERPQVIRWALSRLKVDFPERHDAFLGNHGWVRYVA
ncbi:Capsular polysaccharide biosynthesis protein [Sulfitobacter noctilucicola]|nr:Capsular polysaccharide biosynthesis protein [Sulfitobacter noctilucicola]